MWGFLEFFLKPNLEIIVYWPVELWKFPRLQLNAFCLDTQYLILLPYIRSIDGY